MNKQEIYALLSARNIWHEVTEHKAVFNMAEIHLPYPEANAKNLFIRDDKNVNLCYSLTMKGGTDMVYTLEELLSPSAP